MHLQPATLNDLDRIDQLESSSYLPDEAASREQLRNRLHYAATSGPDLFVKYERDGELVGYLCGTLATTSLVTDESMKSHDPQGTTICLHSVCVDPRFRGQGIAKAMLNAWAQDLDPARFQRVALISRPNLIPLYESAGFRTLGKSDVVHGPEPWYDCVMDLGTKTE